jgi:uncharacterized protein (TIGR03083 family)
MADTLAGLTPDQWSKPSLCAGWSVHVAAGHILVGAEQTPARFMKGMAANLFRFNNMIDRDAHRSVGLPTTEIIERLKVTTGTTNRPTAPVMAMLGEIVVHGEDIRRPLGLPSHASPEATVSCLDMFSGANFPVGGKKRIEGLHLVAPDLDWSLNDGPEVSGPGMSLLLAMAGRPAGLESLSGPGVTELHRRMATPP